MRNVGQHLDRELARVLIRLVVRVRQQIEGANRFASRLTIAGLVARPGTTASRASGSRSFAPARTRRLYLARTRARAMIWLYLPLCLARVRGLPRRSRRHRPLSRGSPSGRSRTLAGLNLGQVGVVVDLGQCRCIIGRGRRACPGAGRDAHQRLRVTNSKNAGPTLLQHLYVDLRASHPQTPQRSLDRIIHSSSRLFDWIAIRHCQFSNSASCRA